MLDLRDGFATGQTQAAAHQIVCRGVGPETLFSDFDHV